MLYSFLGVSLQVPSLRNEYRSVFLDKRRSLTTATILMLVLYGQPSTEYGICYIITTFSTDKICYTSITVFWLKGHCNIINNCHRDTLKFNLPITALWAVFGKCFDIRFDVNHYDYS